jgi:hypothetical protein
VSEIAENTRQWNGFVCPDCRSIFRVPSDHDGKGVVCPNCKRGLRLPAVSDMPPALIFSKSADASAKTAIPVFHPKVHTKRPRKEDHSWENESSESFSGVAGNRKIYLILFLGLAFLLITLVGTFIFLKGYKKPSTSASATEKSSVPAVIKVKELVAENSGEKAPRSNLSYAVEAEPVVRKFLDAKSISEALSVIRNPQIAEQRMKDFYPKGEITPVGVLKFNSIDGMASRGKILSFSLTTREPKEKVIALEDTPQGLKVDWETWVGWSEIPWQTFISSKPEKKYLFRVSLRNTDYYNFYFSDDIKWKSYGIESPDGEHLIYGYVESESMLDRRIQTELVSGSAPLLLLLKYPKDAKSGNQVLIDDLIGRGWVEQ